MTVDRTGSSRWGLRIAVLVACIAVPVLVATPFVLRMFVMVTGNMETTLQGCNGCTNDRVLVNVGAYWFSDPDPGDVVVYRGPEGWNGEAGGQTYVSRVIAIGGQTVLCCDARNRVLVEDEPLDEPYLYFSPDAGPPLQQGFGPFVVPAGELWLMGDSRNNSADSRASRNGPVAVDDVLGRAVLIVSPVTRLGVIEAVNPQDLAG